MYVELTRNHLMLPSRAVTSSPCSTSGGAPVRDRQVICCDADHVVEPPVQSAREHLAALAEELLVVPRHRERDDTTALGRACHQRALPVVLAVRLGREGTVALPEHGDALLEAGVVRELVLAVRDDDRSPISAPLGIAVTFEDHLVDGSHLRGGKLSCGHV